jgi:hypothetical protein
MFVMQMRHRIFKLVRILIIVQAILFNMVPHESPKSEDFEGTNDEEEKYDGDKYIQ